MRRSAVRRAALPVLVSWVLVLAAAAAPARAGHTPAPRSVTLVGALQSELGCPGDWQPPCAATALQPVAGQPGVFRGTFDVPAGSWEYKVALNGSWEENYGDGGAAGGANITLAAAGGPVTFTYDHATHVISDDRPEALGRERAAHWLRADLLAWDLPAGAEGRTYRLHAAPDGGLEVQGGAITGGTSFDLRLRRSRLPESVRARFPHLAAFEGLELSAAGRQRARGLLTGQLIVAAYDDGGRLVDATGVQIPGVLDDLYASAADAELGPTWPDFAPRLALWAPTAKRVELVLDPAGRAAERRVAMRRGADGVWRARGTPSWRNARYAFDVTVYVPSEDAVVVNRVTDPYSLGLTTNSRWSVLVDLRDPALEPAGWRTLAKPGLAQPEDSTIYELHVRDFSITDETVPEERRGTYLAFAETGSDGMRHLRGLAQDGLNTLHLLPVNDIATIEEDRAQQREPACDLATSGPGLARPAGVHRADPRPGRLQLGLRPAALHDARGLLRHGSRRSGAHARVPRDGQGDQRRRPARGHGRRLQPHAGLGPGPEVDPRPDRPGLLPAAVAHGRRRDLHVLCQHGVRAPDDGEAHGRVRRDLGAALQGRRLPLRPHGPPLQGEHARRPPRPGRADAGARRGRRQADLRLRGGLELRRGGRRPPLRAGHPAQHGGHGHRDVLRPPARRRPRRRPVRRRPARAGLRHRAVHGSQRAPVNGTAGDQAARLLLAHDQIKVGLAGNLRDFTFTDRTGTTVKGSQVDYNGQPAGYAADPSETITYVDAHDNETLFDALQFKLPQRTSMADRVRMNTVALATTALAQSPSFWHAGADLLRSKSLDRNSYNSGDWFNRIDWSGRESTWGSGLPPAEDNRDKWPFMRPLLEDPALRPGEADIAAARARAGELLRIRFSSPLLRLGTAERIQERVSFPTGGPDQTPGVIVMAIDDRAGEDLDPALEGLVVVFNASDEATTQTVPALAGAAYTLHPEQAGGGDPVVKTSAYDPASGGFTVPARTVAVFVTP
jgi:pullulanase/glycogen debranching enzyme